MTCFFHSWRLSEIFGEINHFRVFGYECSRCLARRLKNEEFGPESKAWREGIAWRDRVIHKDNVVSLRVVGGDG